MTLRSGAFCIRDPDLEEPFCYNGRWPGGVSKTEMNERFHPLEEGIMQLTKLKESEVFRTLCLTLIVLRLHLQFDP